MLWVNIRRVIKTGFISFWRNGVVSIASVLIMTVTLFTIGLIVFISALLTTSLEEIKNKVDINVYFAVDAPEQQILAFQESVDQLPEVDTSYYTSREEALEQFRARHEKDHLTLQALEELDENPLGASLSIRAKETSQYEGIAGFLEERRGASEEVFIDEINYFQNKTTIDRLTRIIEGAEKVGFAVTAFLAIISIIITFNTIRLAIYTSREEISVMRLVGAGNAYIRGPFIVIGIMYGAFAGLLAIALFYPVTLWMGSVTQNFFGGINLFQYYLQNFGEISILIILSGIILGAFSSFLAVRRYLKV